MYVRKFIAHHLLQYSVTIFNRIKYSMSSYRRRALPKFSAAVRYTAHAHATTVECHEIYRDHYRLIQQHIHSEYNHRMKFFAASWRKIKGKYCFQCALSKMSKMS